MGRGHDKINMNISLVAEQLGSIFGFPITNSLIVAWGAMAVLVVFSLAATRNMQMVPTGVQNIFESVVDGLLGVFENVFGNRKTAEQFFPLVATIFFFVLFVNWAEVLPGVGSIGIREVHEGKQLLVPLLRSTSADLNFTLALAIISVLMVQIVGVGSIGFVKYIGKFLNFSSPLNFFVGLLELVSEVAKLISFSFRLFGNIFAGEVLLTVMYVLVPYFVPLPFLAMELFVGLIQAFVFALLTVVFTKMAMTEH